MDTKRKILFVDDQPNILAGMQRMLRKMSKEWDMAFCGSGKEALEILEKDQYDLIISDMMMPEMNGAQLLSEVSELYPSMVRFILSGHSDRELVLQSVGKAHQYIAKPCDPDNLKEYINSSFGLHNILSNPELHNRIASINNLPSPPEIYNEVVRELQSEDASIKSIADLISRDISLSAKILQIVNSAFFGLPQHVESVTQAVNYLGLNTVQGLVLTAGIHDQLKDSDIPPGFLDTIFNHCMAVGGTSKIIAKELGLSQKDCEDAMMAGLLHDIGRLVMVINFKDKTNQIKITAAENSQHEYTIEKEIIGVNHGEIGAHLLSLWGMHDPILEAIAFHHEPQNATQNTKSILTAVYLANALANWKSNNMDEFINSLDVDYLTAIGAIEIVPDLFESYKSEDCQEGVTK